MFSLHAFSATQATSTSLTNLAVLNDPAVSFSGNFLYVPSLSNLLGAYAGGATLTRAQLQSPSLIAVSNYDVTPVNGALLPVDVPPMSLQIVSPVKLVADEALQALVVNTTNEVDHVFVWLSDGPVAPVAGEIRHVRATFTTSATGDAWQNATITLDAALAEGSYQLVGARVEGAHGVAFRFVFPGTSNSIRPGSLFRADSDANDIPGSRNGGWGVWGAFTNRVLPSVDHITDGNTETAVLILDIIKTE